MNSLNISVLSQMADTCYAALDLVIDPSGVVDEDKLRDVLIQRGFSETQITIFTKDWEIVAHKPDTESGFETRSHAPRGNADPGSGKRLKPSQYREA
jgi:hypothetical protein